MALDSMVVRKIGLKFIEDSRSPNLSGYTVKHSSAVTLKYHMKLLLIIISMLYLILINFLPEIIQVDP